MADYRTTETRMWNDEWFCEQPIDGKLLFHYLFTNEHTSVAGIYLLPVKFMAFETGIAIDRVRELLCQFQKDGKVEWSEPVIWVKKMRRKQLGQGAPNVKVLTRIQRDLWSIPEGQIKEHYLAYYRYPIQSSNEHGIPYPELESETETETEIIKGADAPPVNPPKDDAPAKKQTERQAAIKELETAFVTATKLPAPKRETAKQKAEGATLWWTPLGELYDLVEHDVGKAKQLLLRGIQKVRDDKLTYDSPKSILKTARSIYANGSTVSKRRGPDE